MKKGQKIPEIKSYNGRFLRFMERSKGGTTMQKGRRKVLRGEFKVRIARRSKKKTRRREKDQKRGRRTIRGRDKWM